METPYFIAVEAFAPDSGQAWQEYIAWSGLTQLTEVVSLDILLCAPVIDELTAEDWNYNVQENYLTDYFHDLDYLLRRVDTLTSINILAVLLNPESDARRLWAEDRFQFLGYDLIERTTGISALTNCGGFDQAFANEDLSPAGLLAAYDDAREVQNLLKTHYPDEPHADCDLWAIWRMDRVSAP
ncbi:MAG: hypothetical protein KDI79_23980 [Anaerolineae bacterium]|nr:hypothetical protein [Anaerolineae bacterium]